MPGLNSRTSKGATGVIQVDVLSPLLLINVIDYSSKRAAGDFEYLTHKGNTQDNSGRAVNDYIQAHRQLDSIKTEDGRVGLEINIQKANKMRLNKPAKLSTVDYLVINDQPINIVDDFQYLGS